MPLNQDWREVNGAMIEEDQQLMYYLDDTLSEEHIFVAYPNVSTIIVNLVGN